MNETIFERELKRFKTHLTQSEQNSFTDTTIKDLHSAIAAIQKKQLSNRTNKNVTRLRIFLEAVDSLTKVLDIFVNVNDFVAFVWGPMKFLLLVGHPNLAGNSDRAC
jgi:succinylglutamate desuccinylase